MNKTLIWKLVLLIALFALHGRLSAQDTIPPVITYISTEDFNCIPKGKPWTGPRYNVTDNQSDSSHTTVKVSWDVDSYVTGLYTVTIEATDANGNKTKKVFTVIVKDCTPPVINKKTMDSICHKVNTPYTPEDPIATDESAPFMIHGTLKSTDVDITLIGVYIEVWEFEDVSGNKITGTRKVYISASCTGGLGTHDVMNPLRTIYPQPANEVLNLHLPGFSGMQIRICSADGKLIYDNKLTENTVQIPTQEWATGIYMLMVSNEVAVYSYKIIIRH